MRSDEEYLLLLEKTIETLSLTELSFRGRRQNDASLETVHGGRRVQRRVGEARVDEIERCGS